MATATAVGVCVEMCRPTVLNAGGGCGALATARRVAAAREARVRVAREGKRRICAVCERTSSCVRTSRLRPPRMRDGVSVTQWLQVCPAPYELQARRT